jgi:hypothetical protein
VTFLSFPHFHDYTRDRSCSFTFTFFQIRHSPAALLFDVVKYDSDCVVKDIQIFHSPCRQIPGLYVTLSNNYFFPNPVELFFIVALPCILISSKFLCQQMHSLLKHKMLQLTLKISLYLGSYMFRSLRTIIKERTSDLTKVTVFVEIISKNTSLKLLLCCGNMCFCL